MFQSFNNIYKKNNFNKYIVLMLKYLIFIKFKLVMTIKDIILYGYMVFTLNFIFNNNHDNL